MAVVQWHEAAWRLFNEHVDHATYEFGKKTGNKWLDEMASIDSRLRQYPESYSPEPLLRGREILYRGCHIMQRFKIIYYYDASTDIVHIVDLWDTRQNPQTLKWRIQ